MPSTTKAQATSARMALAARKGKIPVGRLRGGALSMYKSKMSNAKLKHYTKVKGKGKRRKGRKRKYSRRRRKR